MELTRTLIEVLPDAIVVVDVEGLIRLTNSRADSMFGYATGELAEQAIEVLIPERFAGSHAGHRRRYTESMGTRDMGVGLALFGRRKDGSEFPVEVALGPYRSAEGPLVLASIRDRTEQAEVEEFRRRALEDRNRILEEASRTKSQFLANMSHELRTPLNSVIGFAALLRSGRLGAVAPQHAELLDDIHTGGHHLLRIINNILDLSRVEAGRMALDIEDVDLAQLVRETAESMRGQAAARRLTLELELVEDCGVMRTDATRVRQILLNYLSNAIKFTPEGGRVTVSAVPHGGEQVRVRVRDTGIGIRKRDVGALFTAFSQLDSSMSKQHQGAGLGLAVTRQIAEALGGRVRLVESAPGQGSTFEAVLPRTLGDAR